MNFFKNLILSIKINLIILILNITYNTKKFMDKTFNFL